MDAITYWITQYGCVAIFCLLMLGIVGLPVPDEILLTFVGYLIFARDLKPRPRGPGGFFGQHLRHHPELLPGAHLRPALDREIRPFHPFENEAPGPGAALVQPHRQMDPDRGLFLPGVRHFTGFVAGTSKLQLRVFAGYAYLGALFWAATFISLGYFLGAEWPADCRGLAGHLPGSPCYRPGRGSP